MKKNLGLLILLIVLMIISGVIYYYTEYNDTRISENVAADFAIEDTSYVNRIIITDAQGKKAELARDPLSELWMLNNKFHARKDGTDLLLKTFRRIKIKSKVPQTTQETVVKMIAASGIRVDIYHEADLLKSYLIGTCTQDHFGTYMVLEMPDGSRSPEPLIMNMDGFTGCLRQRFFTDEDDWRYTGIFNYPNLDIQKIEVTNYARPNASFHIQYGGENDLRLTTPDGMAFPVFDTLAVKDYMLLYKKLHLETYNNHLQPEQLDSIKQSQPAYTFTVIDNQDNRNSVDVFWKKSIKVQEDPEGNVLKWDGDRMYGLLSSGELVLVQRYGFNPLMQPISRFIP